MQALGIDYLRYSDGLERSLRQEREEGFRRDLLKHIVKASLVASGGYHEDVLFEEYFPPPSDADVDFSDSSGWTYQAPTEDEMAILTRMLEDKTVTVDGAPLEGPGAVQVSGPNDEVDVTLPPPREFDLKDIEQDSEWV